MGSNNHSKENTEFNDGYSHGLEGKRPTYLDFNSDSLESAEAYFHGYFRGLAHRGGVKEAAASEKAESEFVKGAIFAVLGYPEDWYFPPGEKRTDAYIKGWELIRRQ